MTLISESTIKLLACVCVPPQRSLACCAKKAGLLLFQFPGHLELWRVGESDGNGETNARTLNTEDAPKATSEVFFPEMLWLASGMSRCLLIPTGNPGDHLPVKTQAEKLIQLKIKVCG